MKKKSAKKIIKSKAHRKNASWYSTWHAHPYHGHVHWFVFALAAIGVYYIMNSRVQAVVDTTPPTVAITYPKAKSAIVPGSTISVSATAADNTGVASVNIFVSREDKYPTGKGTRQGGSIILTKVLDCTLTTAPYNCVWNVPVGQNITYLTQAVATDTSGNKTISKYVEFLVH